MSFALGSSASQSSQKENPFAKLANAKPLSGASGSQPPQQPSLFSGLGAPPKPAPSLSGFSTLGLAQGQSTATNGGAGAGLLGLSQLGSSQPRQSQNNPASSQSFASSLLALQQSQQLSQNANGQPQGANGQQPIASAKAGQPAYLQSLLEKGKKRAHAADGGPAFGDLPSLQLGLEDIAKRARELGGFGSQDKGHPTDGKASDPRLFVGFECDGD